MFNKNAKRNMYIIPLKESDTKKYHICIQKQMQFYIKDRKKQSKSLSHTAC